MQFLVEQFVKNMNTEDQHSILNPSTENVRCFVFFLKVFVKKRFLGLQDELSNVSTSNGVKLVSKCVETLITKGGVKKLKFETHMKNNTEQDFEKELQKYSNYLTVVPKMSHEDLQLWLKDQVKEVDPHMDPTQKDSDISLTKIIDAVLQPDVIQLIKNKLL